MSVPVPPPNPNPDRRSSVRAWARRHPWRFTLLCVATAFLVASVLPIWTAWHFHPRGFLAGPSTFWEAASAVWDAARHPDGNLLVTRPYVWVGNATKLVGLVVVAGFVARRYAAPPPDQAADYDDAGPPGQPIAPA